MKRLVAAAATLATLVTTGCAGMTVTQLWRDPDFVSRSPTRVFIIAAMDNSANPAQFENAMAQALRSRGFQATTNLGNFPPGRIDRMAIRQYVAENQVDLILMTRLTTEPATPIVVTKTAAVSSGWPGSLRDHHGGLPDHGHPGHQRERPGRGLRRPHRTQRARLERAVELRRHPDRAAVARDDGGGGSRRDPDRGPLAEPGEHHEETARRLARRTGRLGRPRAVAASGPADAGPCPAAPVP